MSKDIRVYIEDILESIAQVEKYTKKITEKEFSRNKMLQDAVMRRLEIIGARTYEKITNQRDDFLHKLSHYYISNYGFIAVEDLQIKNMVRNRHLAKAISDASWSKFIQMLEYKAERAGIRVVKVEPRGTTQICSSCGTEVHKELWNRIHKCECGLEIDRDYNSAINILKKALLSERQEYTPVEIEPLLSNEQARSGKQEATELVRW